MSLSLKPDYRKVLNAVQQVLRENYVITPPIDVVEIANNYGLIVFESDFVKTPNIAGFIDPDKKKIFVNKNDTSTRKFFTIAHELGHWLLHQSQLKEDPDSYAILYRSPLGMPDDNFVEKEANFFAANLLVPTQMLDDFFRKKNYGLATIAEIFHVSQEVVGYRIKNEYGKRVSV